MTTATTPDDIAQLSDDDVHKLLTTALGRIFQHIDLTFDEMYPSHAYHHARQM